MDRTAAMQKVGFAFSGVLILTHLPPIVVGGTRRGGIEAPTALLVWLCSQPLFGLMRLWEEGIYGLSICVVYSKLIKKIILSYGAYLV